MAQSAHVVRYRMVGDKVRIIAGCIAGCYYEGGVFRPDMGRHVVEMHNSRLGRTDLVNVKRGTVTPLQREGRMIGRAIAS